jgi:aspartate aminotransferase-like enzyme
MMVSMEDHRSPNFPHLTHAIMAGLKDIFRSKNGTPFVFPSSGTGCWEAALTNTLSPGDKVLAARFGQFSHLWIDMCQRLGLDVHIVECEWGTGVPLQQFADILKSDTQHQFKAVLACHNETATGVTSDIAGVREALDDAAHPALLFVDCVSSLGCIRRALVLTSRKVATTAMVVIRRINPKVLVRRHLTNEPRIYRRVAEAHPESRASRAASRRFILPGPPGRILPQL